jgi:2-hydroxychromene-2-carboxylate isomerase
VRYRAFLLGPIFAEQGWNDSPFNLYPAMGRYLWRDMVRLCEGYGLAFQHPSSFPRGGLLAARVCCIDPDARWLPEFVRGVYEANFARDRDISQPAVLAEILDDIGQNSAELLRETQSADVKQQLRDQTEQARSLGIFGAPSFVVGRELFWGNDRLGDAIACASLGGLG